MSISVFSSPKIRGQLVIDSETQIVMGCWSEDDPETLKSCSLCDYSPKIGRCAPHDICEVGMCDIQNLIDRGYTESGC